MPRYDYQCENGHVFETEQSVNDPLIEECFLCSRPVKRLISAPAFILKGGNWYRDGYSSSPAAKKSGGGKKDS